MKAMLMLIMGTLNAAKLSTSCSVCNVLGVDGQKDAPTESLTADLLSSIYRSL